MCRVVRTGSSGRKGACGKRNKQRLSGLVTGWSACVWQRTFCRACRRACQIHLGGGYRQHTAGIGFEFADLVTRLIKGYSEHTPVTLALAHPAAAGIPLEPPLESGGRSTGRRVVSREVGWWARRAGTRWCYIRCMCTPPLSLFIGAPVQLVCLFSSFLPFFLSSLLLCTPPLSLFIGAPVQLVCLFSYFLPSLLSTCARLLSLSL